MVDIHKADIKSILDALGEYSILLTETGQLAKAEEVSDLAIILLNSGDGLHTGGVT